MRISRISILAIALLLPLSVCAQKKKRRSVKKPVVEVPVEDPRITNMREMTQKIVIIDSIVVPKQEILSVIRLSQETGSITSCEQFFGKRDEGMLFLNEMGNKIYFSQPDDSLRLQLFTSDKLGGQWSRAQAVKGISEGISEASFPFMLTDGTTFYFAGKGAESIGGYDIFFTRYDAHSSSFLRPENIGMPFNSEANDYMFAIDEFNRIGYFVSDRRQPEGMVCVYVFIPSESRTTYDPAIYTEQQIRDFADIARIADTWGNGAERKAALARWKSIDSKTHSKKGLGAKGQKANEESLLIINDALTYSSVNDFRSPEAKSLYKQLVEARQQLGMLESELDKTRQYYAKANTAERNTLREEIISAEQDVLRLNAQIKKLEKEARNAEIKFIN